MYEGQYDKVGASAGLIGASRDYSMANMQATKAVETVWSLLEGLRKRAYNGLSQSKDLLSTIHGSIAETPENATQKPADLAGTIREIESIIAETQSNTSKAIAYLR